MLILYFILYPKILFFSNYSMKLSTKVAYNTIIQIISKAISTLLGLAAIAIITRYLGQNGFGEYTTVITFISFFAVIADFGLTLITVQMISRPDCDEKKVLGNLLALRLVTAVVLLGVAPLIAIAFPYSKDIKIGIFVVSFAFLFNALNQILVGLFQKNLRMDKVSIAEIISRLILVLAFIVTVKFDFGLMGILIATILSNGASFFLHYIFSLSFQKIKLEFDFIFWWEIIKKSWPLALTIILNLIYLRTDTLLLSVIPRASEIGIIGEVGLYGAAYKVIDVLITLPFMFAGIILPILTARWAENDLSGFKNIMQRSFDVMVIIAVPLIIGTQFVASQVMTAIAGQDFFQAGKILQLLIIACGAIFFGVIFSHAVIAIDKQKKIIGAYIFTASTSLIGYLFFIPRYSYLGAAWITIYSEAAIAAASLYLVWKYTSFFPKILIVFKSFFASIVMGIVIYLISKFFSGNLAIILILAGITYFATLFALGGIKKEDLLLLANK